MKQRKYNNLTAYQKLYHQAGYALVTSMLLLLMLATMGVSMYGNVNIQEQMAFNMRVKNRTFIAADSMLQSNWTRGQLTKVRQETDPVELIQDTMYDQDISPGNSIDLVSTVTACFAGQMSQSLDNGLDDSLNYGANDGTIAKNQKFKLIANAQENATNAETELHQGGFMLMPAGNKAANCP